MRRDAAARKGDRLGVGLAGPRASRPEPRSAECDSTRADASLTPSLIAFRMTRWAVGHWRGGCLDRQDGRTEICQVLPIAGRHHCSRNLGGVGAKFLSSPRHGGAQEIPVNFELAPSAAQHAAPSAVNTPAAPSKSSAARGGAAPTPQLVLTAVGLACEVLLLLAIAPWCNVLPWRGGAGSEYRDCRGARDGHRVRGHCRRRRGPMPEGGAVQRTPKRELQAARHASRIPRFRVAGERGKRRAAGAGQAAPSGSNATTIPGKRLERHHKVSRSLCCSTRGSFLKTAMRLRLERRSMERH